VSFACSEPLPVGVSSFGLFFGGVGGQSDVEIGIAQHDAEFKWLLKKSADGSCIILYHSHTRTRYIIVTAVSLYFLTKFKTNRCVCVGVVAVNSDAELSSWDVGR
jgi:hypothetical protein